jgi:CDGSH-type Zn-finger protein
VDNHATGSSRSALPPATITPYPDGPYLVRGDFVVQDQEGNEMRLGRQTVALCRCGKSRMRPFCDGTHKLIGFEAPSGLESWPRE